MYMRFNPYHGGLLMERITLEEFRAKYPEAKLWQFDAFSGAVIPLSITKDDPLGYNQPVPDSLPKFINADIRIVNFEKQDRLRTAITLEAVPEDMLAPGSILPNFTYDFCNFTFAKMWQRGATVFMDSWNGIGQVVQTAKNSVGGNSNGWITISQQDERRAYIFTMAFTERSIKETDLFTAWKLGFLRVNTQVAYDDDGRIVDIKQFNLRLGLTCGGGGLDECEEKYYNPPLPEVN